MGGWDRRRTALRRGPEAYALYLAKMRAKKRQQRAARYAAGLSAEGKPLRKARPAGWAPPVLDPMEREVGCRDYLIETSGLPYVERAAYEYGLECGRRGVVPDEPLEPFRRQFEDGWGEGAKVAGIPLFDAARACPPVVRR